MIDKQLADLPDTRGETSHPQHCRVKVRFPNRASSVTKTEQDSSSIAIISKEGRLGSILKKQTIFSKPKQTMAFSVYKPHRSELNVKARTTFLKRSSIKLRKEQDFQLRESQKRLIRNHKSLPKNRSNLMQSKKYFQLQLSGSEQLKLRYLYFAQRFIEPLQQMQQMSVDEQISDGLDRLKRQVNFTNDLPLVMSSILLKMSKVYTLYFWVETAIRCLLEAELMSRQCQYYPLVIKVITQLIQDYLKVNMVEQARVKAVNLLHLAVITQNLEVQITALNRLSICYFYTGNVARSRLYMKLAEEGLSQPDRVNARINFSNQSRIYELERLLGSQGDADSRQQIIVQHQPYQTQVTPISGKSKIGKLKIALKETGSKMLRARLPRSRLMQVGHNSGQVYKMHKSPNRNWENYLYSLNRKSLSSHGSYFIPNDRSRKSKAVLLLDELQDYCIALQRLVQAEPAQPLLLQ